MNLIQDEKLTIIDWFIFTYFIIVSWGGSIVLVFWLFDGAPSFSYSNLEFIVGTPDFFSFEHFLPWIDKIMKVYPENQENSKDFINNTGFSDEYYKRKIN